MSMSAPQNTPDPKLCADVFSSLCTSRGALQHLTGRWGSLAMVALLEADSPMRFAVLRRLCVGTVGRTGSLTV